jgi:protein-disulfide isomerase
MTTLRALRRLLCLLALLALALPAGPASAAGSEAAPPLTRSAVEELIRQYILDHPEIILESVRTFQERQRAEQIQRGRAAVASRQQELLRDPASPVGGNPQGDVTVVEFFDYRCGYCRQAAPMLEQLVASDPKLRVVYKELPILGPDSLLGAKAALAAHAQGKYLPFHGALMALNAPLTMAEILGLAAQLSLDPAKLQADMNAPATQAAIQKNQALAQALGLSGTPAFIVGSEVVPGAVELSALRELVAKARRK